MEGSINEGWPGAQHPWDHSATGGGGLNGAVEAPVSLLEADVVGQLVAVGVQLAHLALGLQRVPGGCSSLDAAGDGWGHAERVGEGQKGTQGKDLAAGPLPRNGISSPGWGARVTCHRRNSSCVSAPSRRWHVWR